MTIPKSQKLQNEESNSAPDQVDSNGPLKNFSSCEAKPVSAKACKNACAHATGQWKPLNGLVIVKCAPADESIIITSVNNAPSFKFEGEVISVASDVTNVAPGDYIKFSKPGIVSDSIDPADSSLILLNHKSILCSRG